MYTNRIRPLAALTLLCALAGACDAPTEDSLGADSDFDQEEAAAPLDQLATADPDVEKRAAERESACSPPDAEVEPEEITPSRGLLEPRWRIDESEDLALEDIIAEPTEEELAAAREYSSRFAPADGVSVRPFERKLLRSSSR